MAQTARKVIDIGLNKEETYIELEALKPGDRIIDSIKIRNQGNVDIIYNHYTELKSGSKKYYDQLIIKVTDSTNCILYEGMLKDFTKIENRKLIKNSDEELTYEIHIPHELGNEYQGLSASVLLVYYAEEDQTPNSNEDFNDEQDVIAPKPSKVKTDTNVNQNTPVGSQGSQLPNTATNIYNLLLIGTVLMTIGLLLFLVTGRLKRKNYSGKG
jgi:LPXTG-motif cell wall-anchored protein